MSMSTQDFVDYVLAIAAQAGSDPTAASVLDASMVVEFILPFVLREAARRALKMPNSPQTLMRAHSIEINDGFASLPAGVEEEFAKTFEVGLKVDDLGTDQNEFMTDGLGLWSHYENYGDFIRETDDLLPRFCVRDSKIFVNKDGGVVDGDFIVLYGLTIPQVPTNPDEAIPVGNQILDDCLQMVVAALKGQMPMSSIGITKEAMKVAA